MLMVDPVDLYLELIERRLTHGLGKNCIVSTRHWQQPLGCTQHEDCVEVEANCSADGTVNHTVAESTVSPACHVEFGSECTLEDSMCGRWLDTVERCKPRKRFLDAAERLLVVFGPVGVCSLGAEQ